MGKAHKIGIVGAGNIGGTIAFLLAIRGYERLTLVDIDEGIAKAKALDIGQAAACAGFKTEIAGSSSYDALIGCDAIAITAGMPRKPGMDRDQLLEINSNIVKDIARKVAKACPNAFVLVITNPLDSMAYLFQRVSGMDKRRVVGMGGMLDAVRFRFFLSSATGITPERIGCHVIGSHDDKMVIMARHAKAGDRKIEEMLSREEIGEAESRTRGAGGEIVSLMRNGSAYYAPATCAVRIITSHIEDRKEELIVSTLLDGQFGIKGVFANVPAIIGKDGVERIIETNLEESEKESLSASISSIKETNRRLKLD